MGVKVTGWLVVLNFSSSVKSELLIICPLVGMLVSEI